MSRGAHSLACPWHDRVTTDRAEHEGRGSCPGGRPEGLQGGWRSEGRREKEECGASLELQKLGGGPGEVGRSLEGQRGREQTCAQRRGPAPEWAAAALGVGGHYHPQRADGKAEARNSNDSSSRSQS